MIALRIAALTAVLLVLMSCSSGDDPAIESATAPQQLSLNDSLKQHLVPLDSVLAGQPYGDLEPLRALVGDARVVGLGEATHGSREFFQMKHRLLEFLVQEMDFNVFGIEAAWFEAYEVDSYIKTGEGEAGQALADLYFWTWNTQAVLDMILWMETYNANPENLRKLSFVGFDMQFPTHPMNHYLNYVKTHDPNGYEHAVAELACFADTAEFITADVAGYSAYIEEGFDYTQACSGRIRALLVEMDEKRDVLAASSGAAAFEFARQCLQLTSQAEIMFSIGNSAASWFRDESMAQNVNWFLEHGNLDDKMVLWAHNYHVGNFTLPASSMGGHLKRSLGEEGYFNLGFLFSRGGFTARDGSLEGDLLLSQLEVGPPREDSYEAVLSQLGSPLFLLPLNQPLGDPAGDWLWEENRFRSIGSVYFEQRADEFYRFGALPRIFDAVIYIEETTPTAVLGPPLVARPPRNKTAPAGLSQ